MAGSVNQVTILGRLGSEPEVRNLPSGGKVVNLSVATSESWKDRNTGDRREKTEWHKVVIFSEGLVKIAEQYLHKGDQVYLQGQLQTRKWQNKEGQDQYTTEIILNNFASNMTLLGGKSDGGDRRSDDRGRGDDRGRNDDRGRGNDRGSSSSQSRGGYGGSGGDDDIPF